jgi:iron(III) transport system ATP-binding protein
MISIKQLRKEFPAKDGVFTALHALDLEVGRGEFFVLLGPSGSGKSTLLRCVAGIDAPQGGEISLDGRLIYSSNANVMVRPEERGLGMVFQSYAVWPHLTVYENVALPLQHGARRIAPDKVRDRVMHALSLVQMETFAERPVPYLSGGQQQRVALARALAVEPVVLLMDEPLSNLDARLREEVRHQILSVTRRVGVTVLYVTHDQTEAMALGDRVAVMSEGRIMQIDAPDTLYLRPANPMVAEFLGQVNWFEGESRAAGDIESPLGPLRVASAPPSGALRVGIRPASVQIAEAPSGAVNEFRAQVTEEAFLGEQIELQLKFEGGHGGEGGVGLEVRLPRRTGTHWHGKTVYARIAPDEILVFPKN